MKSILVLGSILITSYANAAPALGDMVRYQMTTTSSGFSQVTEQKMEVTAVNASAGTFTMNVTVSYQGTVVTQTSQTSDLNSASEAESTLDHCSDMPADMAKLETITVPAGTFKVCHISMNQGGEQIDQYMGRVLFGLVKSVAASAGTSTTFELVEVKKH